MTGRSVAVVIGFLGGLLVLLGGLVRFVLALAGGVGSSSAATLGGPLLGACGILLLGLLILFTARPRFWWWPGRRLFNGILLIAFGALAWIFAGGSLLVLFGSVLTLVAGVILPLEGYVMSAFGLNRLFRRRWF